MKKINLIIVLLVGVAFFISCDSRTQQELEGIVQNPTYVKNIKAVMDAKCVSCHSQSTQGYYPDLDTYDNVKIYIAVPNNNMLCSLSADACTSPRMPKGDAPLSNSTITTISNWINNNCPEQ